MSVPDYKEFSSRHLGDNTHIDALNEAARIISTRHDELHRRANGDPDQINEVIDAAIDKFIALSEGNERQALCAALFAYGQAMLLLTGKR